MCLHHCGPRTGRFRLARPGQPRLPGCMCGAVGGTAADSTAAACSPPPAPPTPSAAELPGSPLGWQSSRPPTDHVARPRCYRARAWPHRDRAVRVQPHGLPGVQARHAERPFRHGIGRATLTNQIAVQIRRECARSSWLPRSLSVLSTADLNACRFGLNCSVAQDRSSRLQGPALPDMDFRNRASSNFSPNTMSETGSTGFVEVLVGLQAETAGDDFLLDLGGAAEDSWNPPPSSGVAALAALAVPLGLGSPAAIARTLRARLLRGQRGRVLFLGQLSRRRSRLRPGSRPRR